MPYQAYDPASQVFDNGESAGFVFETSPLVGCTEEMQREISGLFQHTLPEGSSIQFILWADPRTRGILENWKAARHKAPETFQGIFQELAGGRASFLERGVFEENAMCPLRDFRCIVSYAQSHPNDNPVKESALLALKSQIQTALQTLGMPVKSWDGADLLNTLDGIINFDGQTTPADLRWNPYHSLNQQIPSVAYQIDKGGIRINETESLIRTYSVRREPDHWSLHAMGELIGDPLRDLLQIPCPFLIHYGIHIPFQDGVKTRVQSRENWVENQARSKIGQRIPILLSQARELDFVRHQLCRGERFVQTSLSVTLFSTPERMAHADQILINLFRSKGWQLQADSYIQLPAFLSVLPMSWGNGLPADLFYLQKLKTTLSTESANLLPLQGEWKGTHSPGMLLVGRRGQIFCWSPFDNREGNYNVAVVGKSVGVLKAQTKDGKPLSPLKAYMIPKGYVFLSASHPRSFDSRYEEFGLVKKSAIQGVCWGLFKRGGSCKK